MGLLPLEFSECLSDSPFFREKLNEHEKELNRTSKAIKSLISECKDLISAAKSLSKAQRSFSQNLKNFKFECIGSERTEDEQVIENSLTEFGRLIGTIEDARDRVLTPAFSSVIEQLDSFRKDQIGAAKEERKKFEKSTTRYCQSLEKHLGVKNKTNNEQLKEADETIESEKQSFFESSMRYVLVLQKVQEKKKFEFVEALLLFMLSWLNFYHEGFEIHEESNTYINDLKVKLQKCRENFDMTSTEAEHLMKKMLDVRSSKTLEHKTRKGYTREGYLYLQEKKPLGTVWTKLYCRYQKENKALTMIPYSQQAGKGISTDTGTLQSCRRRASDSIERRFCFDLVLAAPKGESTLTMQAVGEEDMQLWLTALDGKEPIYSQPMPLQQYDSLLNDIGLSFIKRCIKEIETRGLDEQGLYRVVGVASKVIKLTSIGLDRKKAEKLDLTDPDQWETKTITSALKTYFRNLPEPIMTFELHPMFIAAAKNETKTLRYCKVHETVHKLPDPNFEILKILIKHLKRVSESASLNLMTVPNLGVCFGPTLLRSSEESIASIIDIKWCNIVVEILIYNYEKIFNTPPDGADQSNSHVLTSLVRQRPLEPAVPSGSPNINLNALPYMSSDMPSPGHVRHHSSGAVPPQGRPKASAGAGVPIQDGRDSTGSFNFSANFHHHNHPHHPQVMSSSCTPGYYHDGIGGGGGGQQPPPPPPAQTYAQVRQRIKPQTGIHSQYLPDQNSNRSSSSESLQSRSSSVATPSALAAAAPGGAEGPIVNYRRPSPIQNNHQSAPPYPQGGSSVQANGGSGGNGGGDVSGVVMRAPGDVVVRHTNKPVSSVQQDTSLGYMTLLDTESSPFPARAISQFSNPNSTRPDTGEPSRAPLQTPSTLTTNPPTTGRRVRALYACDAENSTELSFQPNDIINNVRQSKEPGWLEGILNGKTGLIPANYVEYLT